MRRDSRDVFLSGEDVAGRWPSVSQAEGPQQEPRLLRLDLTSSVQNHEPKVFGAHAPCSVVLSCGRRRKLLHPQTPKSMSGLVKQERAQPRAHVARRFRLHLGDVWLYLGGCLQRQDSCSRDSPARRWKMLGDTDGAFLGHAGHSRGRGDDVRRSPGTQPGAGWVRVFKRPPRRVWPAALGLRDASRRWFPGCAWSQGCVCPGVHVRLPCAPWLGSRKVAVTTQGMPGVDCGFSGFHRILQRTGGTSQACDGGDVLWVPSWTQNGHMGHGGCRTASFILTDPREGRGLPSRMSALESSLLATRSLLGQRSCLTEKGSPHLWGCGRHTKTRDVMGPYKLSGYLILLLPDQSLRQHQAETWGHL